MAQTDARTPSTRAGGGVAGLRHSWVDDVSGIVTGTFIASLGLYLVKSVSAVTGGTAGVSLLVSYASGWPFGVLFLLVNLPFVGLALWKKGWSFTLRTLVAVALVSGWSSLQGYALAGIHVPPLYGVLGGNLLAGVGILILFRHRASLGGLNVLALILQERLGWRAGYVQMVFDLTIIVTALTVVTPVNVAYSAAGAVVLNLVLALNHRPGRYFGT